jgi:misacylated tRNA(Ala) deacylase
VRARLATTDGTIDHGEDTLRYRAGAHYLVEYANGDEAPVVSVYSGEDDVIWHTLAAPAPGVTIGQLAALQVDRPRRLALMRYHTVLHVLNTLALRDYGGWITGVQIGTDYSRIDFKFESFSQALCAELETKVNSVLAENRRLNATFVTEDEFRTRTDLLRTLEARPPIRDGRVRVVEIEGFDAQACGGTHVHTTAEVGRFSIFRTENKGKINKRLYVRLEEAW